MVISASTKSEIQVDGPPCSWSLEGALTQFILAAFPLGPDRIDPPQVTDNQWSDILQVARQESLSALLYVSLQHLQHLDQVPSSVSGSLQNSFWLASVSSRLLLDEYLQVARAFAFERIPSVLLKGGALDLTVYPFEGTRPSVDLDLLIHRSDQARVSHVLEDRGFQAQTGRIGEFREPYLGQTMYSRKVGQRSFWLEVHWHMIDLPYYNQRVPIEWFWERTQRVDARGNAIPILTPTAQLMHLCAHLALHHNGRGLLWLYDLALLLSRRSAEIDWDQVVEAAHSFGLTLAVRQVLAEVQSVWGVGIPLHARQQLKASRVTAGEKVAYAAMGARQKAAGPLWDALFAPDLRLNAHYWLQALLPSPAYIRNRYHVSHKLLLPFYYAARIVAGVAKFMRSGVGAAARSHRAYPG